jgi:hypothetical protein
MLLLLGRDQIAASLDTFEYGIPELERGLQITFETLRLGEVARRRCLGDKRFRLSGTRVRMCEQLV